jgi:glucose-6-phosphate isomerase
MTGGRLWLTGLRRAWSLGGALSRWVADRGVTGVVWTPASYEIDDVADALSALTEAGARPDAALFWDLAVADVRAAADAVRGVHAATGGGDGYAAVWMDPSRSSDATRIIAAHRGLLADIGRPNWVYAMAWTPSRASLVEALVAEGAALALSGVRDVSAVRAVVDRGDAELRKRAEDAEGDPTPPPVFLLGTPSDDDRVLGVELTTEFGLFGAPAAPAPRLPLSPDAEQSGLKAAVDRLAQRASRPVFADDYTPVSYAQAVVRECSELQSDEVLEDVWARDHTLWKEDPTEIADRLGWLDAPERFAAEAEELAEFGRKTRAGGDVAHVLVCGMGGSVFACEMFDRVLGGGIPLTVLDSTHPDQIAAVRSSLDVEKTLFVVSSKSGTTVETRSHLEYFWSLVPRGDRFVAVTDPGTELGSLARERGFLRVFENPPEIGGRFSGLSYFGLVPAAVAGADVEAIVAGARRAMVQSSPGVPETFAAGVRLGAALGEAVLHESRDKITFSLPPQLASFGVWVEQLLAESLGKEDKGMLPVLGEPLSAPDRYGPDRLFCVYSLGDDPLPPQLEQLEGEHPIIRIRMTDTRSLGAEMYRWEVATAIVGYLLDINPFDQPDVEAAKQHARDALKRPAGERPDSGSSDEVLAGVAPPRYIALQVFLPPTKSNTDRAEAVRTKLRERYGVPVTLGFGPRYLHSTGQLHKGGPNTGAFLQVTAAHASDVDVPGMGYSFGRLIDAQADGDLEALRDKGRSVARLSLEALEELLTMERSDSL